MTDPALAGPVFRPGPARGRVYCAARTVRTTEVTPSARLRLDALARYLSDVAEDDLADSGLDEQYGWLVRRVVVAIRRYPVRGEQLRLATFCSATGPRWAERTTTIAGSGTDLVQATAVWVAVARSDGRPVPLGAGFHRRYGTAAQGRTVSARLYHPGPPGPPGREPDRPWPLRASDFDPAGHVNNAIHWAAAEDVLDRAGWLPASVALEYDRPILPGCELRLAVSRAKVDLTRDEIRLWLLDGTRKLASARLAGP